MNQLDKNVIKTLAWFDMYDYSLRAEEVFWYLISDFNMDANVAEDEQSQIVQSLEELVLVGKVGFKDGFYFLPSRKNLLEIREIRKIESLKKIKRAKKVAKILSATPFIRAVILCNVLGYFNAAEEDDIDFFIITKSKRIWIARFMAVWLFKIFDMRPNKKTIKNKFCFSFFVSEDNINLENLKLISDPYLSWWIAGLLPLWEQNGVFENFLKANSWNKKYLPNFLARYLSFSANAFRLNNSKFTNFIKRISEIIVGLISEKIFKFFQLKIMPQKIKEQMNKTNGVIVNDKILKFHLNDTREKLASEYGDIIKKI